MNLVIVESPAKSKTIGRYLGKGYTVSSSYGHVRDLPKKEIGVDVEHNFAPKYVVPPKAKKIVSQLKKAADKADIIYFATDEDREGEAIAWHLAELLEAPKDKVKRITFAEITERAIKEAVANPRDMDLNLVDAQQARRILDRLVGYELSPFLWNKVRRGLSAGRVQSVAVRLIVDREREVEKFKPEEFWTIEADLKSGENPFTARLRVKEGKILEKMAIGTKKDADKIVKESEPGPWKIEKIDEKVIHRNPYPPFTTSTLQQAASNQFGFSAARTMRNAQRLYEGVEMGSEGHVAFITYMRTDSVQMANEAVSNIRNLVKDQYGEKFLPPTARKYATKSKSAQEAHEAIRPTDPSMTPDKARGFLGNDEAKLYDLIWRQAVSSQMSSAAFKAMTVDITTDKYSYRATGSLIEFPGYLEVAGTKSIKETILPPLEQGQECKLEKIRPLQHSTQPPPRFTEAGLVKALEEHGIGRPSTYAPTIETIQAREYVTKGEDKRFHPSDTGTAVNDILVEHFPNIVDIQFTARMESELDGIAQGKHKMPEVLKAFYEPFHKNLENKSKTLSKEELTTKLTDQKCPDCGKPLAERLGRRGKFLGCTGYPDCKYTAPLSEEEKEAEEEAGGKICPDCNSPLVVKRSRFGVFLGCSKYPDCKHTERIEQSTGIKCPKCKEGEIVARRSKRGRTFYGCNSYPKCKNAVWSKPTGDYCSKCGSLMIQTKDDVACSNKNCPEPESQEEESKK